MGKNGEDIRNRFTICITSFERHDMLRRLLDSIRERFVISPQIIVADNSEQFPQIDGVVLIRLPFDSGVSACRNALVEACNTKYMLLCEEDFIFKADTRIQDFIDILDDDEEVGVVGGRLVEEDKLNAYCCDFDRFRDTIAIHSSNGKWRSTGAGTTYRLCDMVFNWMLLRKEVAIETKWNNKYKLGEHWDWFWQLTKARQWRVAMCPSVVAIHDRFKANVYQPFRERADEFCHEATLDNGFSVLHPLFKEPEEKLPNIVLMGVGHAGTTVAARMIADENSLRKRIADAPVHDAGSRGYP